MAVLMASTALGVQRRPATTYDPQGWPIPGEPQAVAGPWPGRARERGDGSWSLALDPAAWPVAEGDFVVEPATARRWVVTEADVLHNTEDETVDYVRASGHERVEAGTEPAGGVNERGV